jgi:hypothetical protein
MWTLRQDQLDAFEQWHLQKFEDEMVEDLKEFAPRHWKVIGEQTGREVIRLGIEQAEKHGFTNRGPVHFYIEMMFMFGSYFDTDPQYPWAAQILNDETMDEMVRADRLYDKVTEYWDAVAGPENSFTLAALRKLSQTRLEDYLTLGMPLERRLLKGLQSIYPQKCDYLGERPLLALLKKTFELADKHGFTSNEETFLLTALGFFLGHEWERDPLHRWIGRQLADIELANVAVRSAELRTKAMSYLQQALEGGEEAA